MPGMFESLLPCVRFLNSLPNADAHNSPVARSSLGLGVFFKFFVLFDDGTGDGVYNWGAKMFT